MYFKTLGSFNPIVLSDSDDDFAGFKKKGNKIVFSESDDDDGFSQPAPKPSSSGIYLMFSLIFENNILWCADFSNLVKVAWFLIICYVHCLRQKVGYKHKDMEIIFGVNKNCIDSRYFCSQLRTFDSKKSSKTSRNLLSLSQKSVKLNLWLEVSEISTRYIQEILEGFLKLFPN